MYKNNVINTYVYITNTYHTCFIINTYHDCFIINVVNQCLSYLFIHVCNELVTKHQLFIIKMDSIFHNIIISTCVK